MSSTPEPAAPFAVRGIRVLDDSGAFTPPTDVVVRDGAVERIGLLEEFEGRQLDGRGRWLLPGFADCHAHLGCLSPSTDAVLAMTITRWTLEIARAGRQLLEMGITLVRDPGSVDAGIRDGFATGAVPGPTLRVAGPPISQTGGHADGYIPNLGVEAVSGYIMPDHPGRGPYRVDGPEEMRKAVRTQIRAGVDWIKLCTTGGLLSTMHDHPAKSELSPEEIRMAVIEATRAGIPVVAHAYGGDGLTAAVEAGVRSIEHGMFLSSEQADLMAERGCWLVPTLVVVEELFQLADEGLIPPSAAARVREVHELSGRQIEVARAAGVRIAVGSDLVTQGRNLEELALLGDAGMPSGEVLLAATAGGAELMRLQATHGRIAPGYVFDAVVLDSDPTALDVFRTPGAVRTVFQSGRIVRSDRPDWTAA